MEHLKLDYRKFVSLLIITLSFTSCYQIIDTIDILGVFPPREQKLELQLKKQAIGEPFTFIDYCKEKYDNIFLVYPYFNTEREDFVNLKMSDKLRSICESNAYSDSFLTLLFINDGIVKVYSIIATADANFAAREVEKHYIFPFQQKFILDENRYVHIYKE